ncbi:MAG: hypothetical protein VZQ98_02545 [Bacteroidales bacterium]|nr:hypothetical protein [Bacteroidales bacterium]
MYKKRIAKLFVTLLTIGCFSCFFSCNYINEYMKEHGMKGDMVVRMEISVPEVLRSLANPDTTDSIFVSAITMACERHEKEQTSFVDLFADELKNKGVALKSVFSEGKLKADELTDDKVVKILKKEVKQAANNSISVMKSRLDKIGVTDYVFLPENIEERITIEIHKVKDPEYVRKMIVIAANLEFWETAEFMEFGSFLNAINNMAREIEEKEQTDADTMVVDEKKRAVDSLFRDVKESQGDLLVQRSPLYEILFPTYLYGMSGLNTPSMGIAEAVDTAKVSYYIRLAKEKNIFPSYIYPTWTYRTYNENDSTVYELVALRGRKEDGKAAMSGDIIKEAKAMMDEESGYAYIGFDMTEEAALKWANLTRENIDRSIAIVLNGRVYCYPRVRAEITNGRNEIAGTFTMKEAQEIADLLNLAKYPVSVRIIED